MFVLVMFFPRSFISIFAAQTNYALPANHSLADIITSAEEYSELVYSSQPLFSHTLISAEDYKELV